MTDLSSCGSIAVHILETIPSISAGVSGNMIEIVDQWRQYIANYTGDVIDANSIAAKYQPAITNFAKAETIDLMIAQPGGESISLGELSINDSGDSTSAAQYRVMAEYNLKALGRHIQFNRTY